MPPLPGVYFTLKNMVKTGKNYMKLMRKDTPYPNPYAILSEIMYSPSLLLKTRSIYKQLKKLQKIFESPPKFIKYACKRQYEGSMIESGEDVTTRFPILRINMEIAMLKTILKWGC